MRKYSFMNKNKKVFDFSVDEDTSAIMNIDFSGNLEYAPYILHKIKDEKEMRRLFTNWLNERYQINSPWYKRNQRYDALEITSNKLLYSYGFNLSDQYFIKPYQSNISWEKKNFFENDFKQATFLSLTSLERNYDYSDIDTLYSPDVTTGGELFKYWSINQEQKRILHKGCNTFKMTEPINEYMATKVCEILKLDHVHYTISKSNDLKKTSLFSECETFINPNTELISTIELVHFRKENSFEERSNQYIQFLEKQGIVDAKNKIKKMFILDVIMSNHDRHLKNSGVIRAVKTLKFLDVAPIFDTGRSLLTYRPDTNLDYDNELSEMGINDLSHRRVLEYCSDISISSNQIHQLLLLKEEYKELLLKYRDFINVKSEEEMDDICSKLEKNIHEVQEIICNGDNSKSKYIYKRINEQEDKEVRKLINKVFQNLERDDFLIPWTEEQMNRFYDTNYSILFGAYDKEKLIAISQIFSPKEIEEEYYHILNISKEKKIYELGGFLVLPEYRNKKVMTELAKFTMNYFENLEYDGIISTVHPENEASNKIVQKLGFQRYTSLTTQSGFLRFLYWKEKETKKETD